MNNKIYVLINKNNSAILKFPKCNIETRAFIGLNGVTDKKIEGDKKTPLGEFELGTVLSTHTLKNIKNDMKYIKINENIFWIDDPKSRYYNQLVNYLKVKKDWNSAEHLSDYPLEYEYLIEIKTNPKNIKGRGSAIFLHCSNNKQTSGCIAIDRKIMKKILENIDNKTKIEIYKLFK